MTPAASQPPEGTYGKRHHEPGAFGCVEPPNGTELPVLGRHVCQRLMSPQLRPTDSEEVTQPVCIPPLWGTELAVSQRGKEVLSGQCCANWWPPTMGGHLASH